MVDVFERNGDLVRRTGAGTLIVFDHGKCGTPSGAGQHRRFGQLACQDCRSAHARYTTERRAAIRETGVPPNRERDKAREKGLRILGERYALELEEIVEDLLEGRDAKVVRAYCVCRHAYSTHLTRTGICRVPTCGCRDYKGVQ